jgi:hypothetical protein
MAGATSGNDAPEESCEVSEISTASSWDELEGDVKDPEHISGLGVVLLLSELLVRLFSTFSSLLMSSI